ncbi:MAG TPA: class I SAM-dependent methyltransferase [Longimicrobiales bacterium]|nr:class I SAM-dependent methyltransferase [Longimicrobiales bacterium]
MSASDPQAAPQRRGDGRRPARAQAVLDHFADALAAAPDDAALWARFSWTLGGAGGIEETLVSVAEAALARTLTHPGVDPVALEPVLRDHLRRLPALGPWLRRTDREPIPPPFGPAQAAAVARSPVLLAVLSGTTLPDLAVDRLVAALRRHLVLTSPPAGSEGTALAVAAARACFRTDYVHPPGPGEVEAVRRIEADLSSRPLGADPGDAGRVALLAAYRPLGPWAGADPLEAWVAEGGAPALVPLVDEQVRAPRREARLAREMPRIGRVPDTGSHPVRAFYESHPYPRWGRLGHRDALDLPTRLEVDFLGRRPQGLPCPERPEVLVAGCGTGHHPLAVRAGLRGARVTALDLSLASLAHAARKAEDLGLDDVAFLQADLLELSAWDRTFDVVESLGVLHHLSDPAAGLEALRERLRPGGLMHVGVYSRRGRRPVYRARALLADLGFGPGEGRWDVEDDGDAVRSAREALLPLLRRDPELRPLLDVPDLYTLPTFRDLFLHPLETAFDLPEIAALLQRYRLEFLGFGGLSRATLAAFRAELPEPDAETDLSAWDAFEARHPGTFPGLYRFWCRAVSP